MRLRHRTGAVLFAIAAVTLNASFAYPAAKLKDKKVASKPNAAKVYGANCAGCHGAHGEGKSGPQLAGKHLKASTVEAIVSKGKPPKMPAFGGKLKGSELKALAGYVSSMKAK